MFDIDETSRVRNDGFARIPGAVSVLVAICAVGGAIAACSFIRFEKGPYVVRDLRLVYSEQEDMTFLSWKLRGDADLDRVGFELYRGDGYRSIELSDAPFPAEPYECSPNHYCFQYQVPGRYEIEPERAPMRSRHRSEGVFSGPESKLRRVGQTFRIDPIALGRNREIDPKLRDWFAHHEFPLRRDWQWKFVARNGERCEKPGSGGWSSLEDRVEVDHEWVTEPSCFAVRPDRRDRAGAHLAVPLPPSAETAFARQSYVPDRIDAPIVYGILFDASIESSERCEDVKEKLVSTLDAAIQARGEHRRLGMFTPISARTGRALSGCEQEPRRRYPLSEMIRLASEAQGQIAPRRIRVLWVYVNNITLRPQERIADQIEQLTEVLPNENRLPVYNWAVGSNPILQVVPWDRQTGWRPIEDETFIGDLKSTAKRTLPFATMDHTDQTNVPIDAPEGVEHPTAFKICQSTPLTIDAIGSGPGPPQYDFSDPAVPWPERGKPFYRVALRPQILVPAERYAKIRVDVVVEACERFCDHRFRSRGGGEYESWDDTPGRRPMEVCQWRE